MITYQQHTWNLLIYMDGDNSLEHEGIVNFNELEYAGPSSYLNIFVLFDRSPAQDTSDGNWIGARLYKINWDINLNAINSQLLWDYGDLNMADPATLTNFIVTCNQYSPADHTILTLWDHGSGVDTRSIATSSELATSSTTHQASDGLTRNILEDDTSNDEMTIAELKSALSDAMTATGKKIDIINMDACLMMMLEIAYELRGEADYIIGSEPSSPAPGDNYISIVKQLSAGPRTAREAAISIVDSFYAKYFRTSWDATYSALSLGTEFPPLITALNTFAHNLINTPSANRQEVRDSWTASTFFPYGSYQQYIDLYSFAQQIVNHVTDTSITTAAASLMTAIDSAVVCDVNLGYFIGKAHGISILLPPNTAAWDYFSQPPGQYTNIDLSKDTEWDDFIDEFVNHFPTF
jgi:hypothetical protein